MIDTKVRVCFKNDPFRARVVGPDGKPIWCICSPVVYFDDLYCGVGVRCTCEDDVRLRHWIHWGLVRPRNLFDLWRSTEMLRLLTDIEETTISTALCAAGRSGGVYNLMHANLIIAKIGQQAYDKIMYTPVPEQIVRATLDNPKDCTLYSITDEVRAGTLLWRQEFTEYGIKSPDEIAASEMARWPWWKKLFQRMVTLLQKKRPLS